MSPPDPVRRKGEISQASFRFPLQAAWEHKDHRVEAEPILSARELPVQPREVTAQIRQRMGAAAASGQGGETRGLWGGTRIYQDSQPWAPHLPIHPIVTPFLQTPLSPSSPFPGPQALLAPLLLPAPPILHRASLRLLHPMSPSLSLPPSLSYLH